MNRITDRAMLFTSLMVLVDRVIDQCDRLNNKCSTDGIGVAVGSVDWHPLTKCVVRTGLRAS